MRQGALLAAALLSLLLLPARAQTEWKEVLKSASAGEAKKSLAPVPAAQVAAPGESAPTPPSPVGPASGGGSPAAATPAATPPLGPGGASPLLGMPPAERAALDKLTAENQLVREEVAKKLRALIEEREELRIRYELAAEQQRRDMAKLDADYQRLSLENRLMEEKNKKALDDLGSQQRHLAAENALDEEKHKKDLAELRQTKERLAQENDTLREKLRTEELKNQSEKMTLDLEGQRLAMEGQRLKTAREKLEDRLARLRLDLDERAKKEEWKNEANKEPLVLKEPFVDGTLTVSDRRIALNGPIFRATADRVTERIHFFNNASDDPIFIVIDSCPGGAVMDGYRIIKAMQASKAPVYVVVKSFAASMAAIITTLAPKSFVYPNALILHHQPWGVHFGNLTQQKEALENMREWWRRLGDPIANKMGLSLDGLVKRMYEKNSDGDWEEFGDEAVKVKWASSVVQEIRETGFVKKPDDKPLPPAALFGLEEKVDAEGKTFVKLPRLEPFNFYWIYNPDRYYR